MEPLEVYHSSINKFKSLCEEEVLLLIKSSSSATSSLDPLPTSLTKRCCSTLLPLIRKVINSSLVSCQRAVVTPLIKKRDASQEDLSIYRPISNLSFLGKLIEKAAVKQIQEYATDNSLHNSLQSAYRPHHSVETALLKVQNDILTALDQRKEVILVLLDFTSAFDTIEHMIQWLTSYLYDRSHVVKVRPFGILYQIQSLINNLSERHLIN